MKDNVVTFPGKRFDPIDSVLFLVSHEWTLQEAITSVMAQITAKHHLTEEELVGHLAYVYREISA